MRVIVGIDEVGRGALAGPVVVGLAAVPVNKKLSFPRKLGILKDSKKLSPKKRKAWLNYFKQYPDIFFTTARVYPRGIERLNISKAANEAALKVFKTISKRSVSIDSVFLDGGLYLGNSRTGSRTIKNAKTIIKGDEKIMAIKIASIVAKVTRDDYMIRLSKKYPAYGFDVHKGYGTKVHFQAIRKNGISIVHRKSFCL